MAQTPSIIGFTHVTKPNGDGTYLVYFTASSIVFDKRLEKDEYFPEHAFRDARYSKSPLFRAEVLHGEIVEFSILATVEDNEDV